ncbi:24720_t:CDS:2 [Gigaspora margarita]|uniref:24720_t:CDS:1 n=1 Tax=Gigaspora margarita TaxID=4874 RepID=A0ABN7X082_GIGMA|nr:24720_t:CDS:2 [Gigaspora margarita]
MSKEQDTKRKKSNTNSAQDNSKRMHISNSKSIYEETSSIILREILQKLNDIEKSTPACKGTANAKKLKLRNPDKNITITAHNINSLKIQKYKLDSLLY